MEIRGGPQGLEKGKCCTHHQKRLKEAGDHSPVSLTSVSRKTMEQVLLEDVAGHRKKVAGNSQQGLTKAKSHQINLTAHGVKNSEGAVREELAPPLPGD